MQYEELEASPGVIWTALNIDYPGHSFSHLGAFHGKQVEFRSLAFIDRAVTEGLNGRLPNQDLYNSLQLISQHTAGVPVVLYNHTDLRPINAETSLWRRVLDPLSQRDNLKESFKTWDNIERHMSHQTLGRPSGVHGLFHP
jgi:glycosylphosphatidylinositol transamidase